MIFPDDPVVGQVEEDQDGKSWIFNGYAWDSMSISETQVLRAEVAAQVAEDAKQVAVVAAEETDQKVQVLKDDLADPEKGAEKIGFQGKTVAAVLTDMSTRVIDVRNYGADPSGLLPSQEALNSAWEDFRNAANNDGSRFTTVKLVVPRGYYRVTDTVNWTDVFSWNLQVECEGAVIVGNVVDKPIIDLTGVRGVEVTNLSIYGPQTHKATCALLLGPAQTVTSGNNRFTNLKTDGWFTVGSVWNIGSETTIWDFCYFQNREPGETYTFIGDGNNRFGAVSEFTETRAPMVPASLTCNVFYSCRFAHMAGGSGWFVEGIFNWSWDIGCYHLSFGEAGGVIRCSPIGFRSTNLRIEGLFETAQNGDGYGGLKDCIRVVSEDDLQTDIRGFFLNAGQPQANRSILRVENESGDSLSSNSRVKLVNTEIICSKTINVETVTPVFSGTGIVVQGDLKLRESPMVNLNGLLGFQGVLYTNNYDLCIPPGAVDLPFSYTVYDESSDGGRAVKTSGVSGGLAVNPGATTQIIAKGSAPNINLSLRAKGTGGIRIGTTAAIEDEFFTVKGKALVDGAFHTKGSSKFELPIELPSYTLAQLALPSYPQPATHTRGCIVVTDATGGATICRSNGTNWIDLITKAPVV